MDQYKDNDQMNNYVVSDDSGLGEGRTESIIYPQGCKEGRNPVMDGDQKVGDHHEYGI